MNNNKHYLKHWHIMAICLMICDVLSIHLAYFAALWLRFDTQYSHIPGNILHTYYSTITVYTIFAICLFWGARRHPWAQSWP